MQFRDIEAFEARRAVVLAIGEGEASRVFRTEDGGATWTETFRNTDPKAFYDCLTFFDRRHGLAMSDPVDGRFRILSTSDGGRSWTPAAQPPPAYRSGVTWLPHSHATALAVGPTGTDLTTNGGRTWRTVDTGSYDTVDCAPDRGGWAAGEQGRVARLER